MQCGRGASLVSKAPRKIGVLVWKSKECLSCHSSHYRIASSNCITRLLTPLPVTRKDGGRSNDGPIKVNLGQGKTLYFLLLFHKPSSWHISQPALLRQEEYYTPSYSRSVGQLLLQGSKENSICHLKCIYLQTGLQILSLILTVQQAICCYYIT